MRAEKKISSTDQFRDTDLDLVVTVCDDAAENCPLWLGVGKRVHLGFPDPAKVEGTEDEILGAFRSTRDAIQTQVLELLKKQA